MNVRTLIRNRYNELDGRQVIQGNFNQLSCDTLIFENMTGNVGYFNNLNVESFTGSSISVNGDLSLTGGNINIYGSVNMTGGYYNYNGVPINNSFYPALSEATAANAVSTWQERTTPSRTYNGLCWSPEKNLFVAVAGGGVSENVLISSNGIDWTPITTSDAISSWRSVCYSKELGIFCACQNTTVSANKIMTSPDGINWTLVSAPDRFWNCVIWVSELNLFVAVASSGTNDRIMTSPNGVNWTLRISPVDNNWINVCWSPELRLLVAVSFTGTGNRVMTSPDGINWTIRISPEDNQWISVCWSSEISLFCAVAQTGANRVMISSDGINWRSILVSLDTYRSVCWSPELRIFCAVSQGSDINRVMTSPDGINWTLRNAVGLRNWQGVVWSPELGIFVAVANSGTNRVMTSSLAGRIPTSFNVFDSSFNNINELGLWNFQSFGRGTPVTVLSSPYTIANGNNWIIVNNTGANTTLTFPTASSWSGREIMIKTIQNRSVLSASSNIIPLHTTTATGTVLNATGGNWANLVSDGTNWVTMQGRL